MTARCCDSGPPLLVPQGPFTQMGTHPCPFPGAQAGQCPVGPPSPPWASICFLTDSQPLREAPGLTLPLLCPLCWPLTPPGVSVLSVPFSFLDQTRGLNPKCEGCNFSNEAGKENFLGWWRHSSPHPRVCPCSLAVNSHWE